jgi:hypothetical protein
LTPAEVISGGKDGVPQRSISTSAMAAAAAARTRDPPAYFSDARIAAAASMTIGSSGDAAGSSSGWQASARPATPAAIHEPLQRHSARTVSAIAGTSRIRFAMTRADPSGSRGASRAPIAATASSAPGQAWGAATPAAWP